MQSPIDISSGILKLIPNSPKLITNYKSSNAILINRGHDIAVFWKGNAGSIHIAGTEFFLQQCHWHSPSEHSIDGMKYDLEMHMVHIDPNGNNIAVFGAFFNIGQPDPFLSQLEKEIEKMIDEEGERVIEEKDPSQLKTIGNMYYRYIGSLTTPPCTEGVIWSIDREIRTVSEAQVNLLRQAVHDLHHSEWLGTVSLNSFEEPLTKALSTYCFSCDQLCSMQRGDEVIKNSDPLRRGIDWRTHSHQSNQTKAL
ncbi:hypothetical protein VNO77_16095 [Canavalia gladiata]|uniref:Carbonic anhydrase n=1 Tax=Canavalia gladiata TaxID=3824 RepID=A0AAN9M156_CANGL